MPGSFGSRFRKDAQEQKVKRLESALRREKQRKLEIAVLQFPSEGDLEVFENDCQQVSEDSLERLAQWLKKRDSEAKILLCSVGGKLSDLLMKMEMKRR